VSSSGSLQPVPCYVTLVLQIAAVERRFTWSLYKFSDFSCWNHNIL